MTFSRLDFKIVIAAIILRLLLMPFLYHPDLKTQYYHGQFLQQGVINIYQYLRENKSQLSYQDTFNYPPLAYFFLGSWSMVTNLFLDGSLSDWLGNWGAEGHTSPEIFEILFILKLPYLILDILVGLLIYKLLPGEVRRVGLIVWFFNPFNLYIIYGLSNFDILPAALTFLGYYFFIKERFTKSGLFWGMAIATKLYPLIFLPVLAMALLKKGRFGELMWFSSMVGLVMAALTIWQLKDFLAVGNSGLIAIVLENTLSLPGNIHVPIFAVGYLIVLAILISSKFDVWAVNVGLVAICFLIYGMSHYHIQWFLWCMPFLVMMVSRNPKLVWVFGPVGLAFLINALSFQDGYLTLGLTSPVFPTIYQSGSVEEKISGIVNWPAMIVLAEMIMIAVGAYLILMIIVTKKAIRRQQ